MNAKAEGPSGVGGWLLLLILLMTLLWPLRGLTDTARGFDESEREISILETGEPWARYKLATWVLLATSSALSVVAGVRLWKDHRTASVVFAVVALWLVLPARSLLYMFAEWVIFNPEDATELLWRGLKNTAFTAVIAGVWTAYLLLSLRVRNTYRAE